MVLLLVFFLVSIGFSFLCSILEAVLLSIPPSQVQMRAEDGTPTGKLLKEYKENIDRPLSAILTLNTIAHTVGAIGVGAQAVKIWGDSVMSAMVVPVVMTLAILILSEIIPKTLGATYWKGLTGFTVKSLQAIIFLLYPLVWLSQLITKVLKKNKEESVLSRREITMMTSMATEQGVLNEHESTIVKNLFRFKSLRVRDIMTPRTVIVAADESMTIREFYDGRDKIRFSRIPIFENEKDNVTGMVLRSDILNAIIREQGDQPLRSLRRKMTIVRPDSTIMDIFDDLMQRREHIALVVDKYGGTSGLVSMEDVIETLLGMEIVDEHDSTTDMQVLARRNWERRAAEMGLTPDAPADSNSDTTKPVSEEVVKLGLTGGVVPPISKPPTDTPES